MLQEKVNNRWFVVLGAILIQLCLGTIYSWSVFTPHLLASGWSKLDTQMVFAVTLASFTIVMSFSSKRLLIIRPHRLARIGGLTLGLGYFLAGLLAGDGFWPVLIGVGIIGGAGMGMGYVVPITVGMRWFPDHKHLITGIAVLFFGMGALVGVEMAGDWGGLLQALGLANTLMLYGVAFCVLMFVGSLWMHMPSNLWSPPVDPTPTSSQLDPKNEDFSIIEMLHTPQFYLIFLTFTLSTGAGLMAIGLMQLYPMEALQRSGYSSAQASTIAATALAVFFGLANGIGRIAWRVIGEWLGRKRAIMLMTIAQGMVFFSFSSMAGKETMLYLGAMLIGFNFGGNFALFPALTADEFGKNTVGQNYPLVFLAFGTGGLLFPILGGILGDMGYFSFAFTVGGLSLILGTGCCAIIFPPHLEDVHKPMSVHGFLQQVHMVEPHTTDLKQIRP